MYYRQSRENKIVEVNESEFDPISSQDEMPGVEASPTPPKKKRWWAVALYWLLGIVLGVMALLVMATVLLYFPPVQKAVVNKVAQSLKGSTGLDITVGRIRVGFPVKLKIGDVTAITAEGDTAAVVGELTAHLGVMPLINGESIPLTGFTLRETHLDYQTPGDSLSLKGFVHEITINTADYGLKSQRVKVGKVSLSQADMDVVALSDTVPDSIPDKPSKMVISVDEIKLDKVRWSFSSSYDSILIGGYVNKALVRDGMIDLSRAYYGAAFLDLDGDLKAVGTVLDFLPLPWTYKIKGRRAYYGGFDNIEAKLDEIYFVAGDGWRVDKGRFDYVKDSTHMYLTGLEVQLPQSKIYGSATLPFKEWMPDSAGKADVDLQGRVLIPEVQRFIGGIQGLPVEPIDLTIQANGYMDEKLHFLVKLFADKSLDLYAKGDADHFFDEKKRKADVLFNLKTGDKTMLAITNFLNKGKKGKAPSWRVPSGTKLSGTAHVRPGDVSADINLLTREGQMFGSAKYGAKSKSYEAHMNIKELNIQQFLPGDTIRNVSGILHAKGRGTDPFSPKTNISFFAKVDTLSYNSIGLKDLTVLSELKNNQLFAAVNSENEALKLTAQVDAFLKKNDVNGSINLFVDTIIPSQLGMNGSIVEGGRLELRSSIQSDLKQYFDFKGEIENFFLQTDRGVLNPTNTYITALTTDTNMVAAVSSGDLVLDFNAHNGLNDFSKRVSKVISEVQTSLKDTVGKLDMSPWMTYYPDMNVKLSMGRKNLMRAYLDHLRIGAQSVQINLATKTNQGLQLDGFVKDYQRDTMKIDNIDLVLRQDSSFFYATATAHKEKFRNQLPFDLIASVTSNVHRSEVYVNWMDHLQRDFVRLGVELWNRPNGDLEFGFTPDPIVLAYNSFVSEGDGFIRLPHGQMNKIDADLKLRSTDGALIAIQDLPSTEGHLLHADIDKFQLTMLKSLNLLPPLEGLVDAKLEWLQKDNKVNEYQFNAGIQNFKYDDTEVGAITAVGQARQQNGDTYAKADMVLNEDKVAFVEYFKTKDNPKMPRMQAIVRHLPLERVNPFLPKKFARLKGTLDAVLSNYDVEKSIQDAVVGEYRGQIVMSAAEVFVPALNETYLFDSKPIVVSDGYAIFNDFALTANDAKLIMTGSAKLTRDLPLNFVVRGRDLQLLNSEPTPEALVYGIVNADTDLRIKGPARAVLLTGDISILGNTDVTYHSQKSELQKKNNYKDLVEFTDFSDTLFVSRAVAIDSLSLGGVNIDLGIHIAPAAEVTAVLNKNGSNRVSIQGGGDFNLTMPPYGTMQLSGVYRMNGGQANLTFEPLFSRRFEVQQGSQIAWSGDIMKPDINFRATSKVQSRVTMSDEPSRMVNFNVSVIAENTLNDLKLRFITEAPEDLSMRNRLQAMSDDEQNRQSILLLSTGYFMGSGAGNAGINERVGALLAGQLNSLMGEALGAEINFGVSDASGARGQGTNYSYSISKRFWNNRINFVVGGKMVTGQAAEGLQQTIIDNMSLEYQIDENGTRFLRLFHKKNFENLLDGEVTETGAGYLIRRRLGNLGDLFKFGNRKKNATLPDSIPPVELRPDSPTLVPPKPSPQIEKIEESHGK